MNKPKLLARVVEAGLSQKMLAERIGMSENTMSSRVCGLSEFKADEISAIASALAITDPAVIVDIFLC